jgi:acetylornithine deacetylase/succinyl-diaminopimelate desuccinylase-like protein
MASELERRLDAIYAIGGGPGANRLGYSRGEDEAHRCVGDWMRQAGLEVEVDPDGNLVGRLPGLEPGLPEVWSGSHLDSVPQGGRFDGPLGVLGALEAVERLGRRRRTLGVVAFREEERGCVGSHGRVSRGGLPGSWVELHHEQGPRLALEGAPLAVVTAIVGYKRVERVIEGRAGHAGTTPMDLRDDALVAAAEEVLRVRDVARGIDGAVATVGRLEVEPGGVNVIPGRVRLTIDARAPDDERLARLLDGLAVEQVGATPPTPLGGPPAEALRTVIAERGLPVVELASGAGHDAGVLARAGVPSAMLFVRALNGGVSHSPEELSSPDDVALAVDVLTDALGRLASG